MTMASSSAPYPDRKVLEGVPRVNFYEGGKRCPEDIILPSVMRAILEYLGEEDYGCKHCLAQNPDCKILCTYAHLVGVSGAASFRRFGGPQSPYLRGRGLCLRDPGAEQVRTER